MSRPIRFALLFLALLTAAASSASTSRLELSEGSAFYGSSLVVSALLHYAGPACPERVGAYPPAPGHLSVSIDGAPYADFNFYLAFDRSCSEGRWTAGSDMFMGLLDIGTHRVLVSYTGGDGVEPTSAETTITVLPWRSGQAAASPGTIAIGFASLPGSQMSCGPARAAAISFVASGDKLEEPPPRDERFPFGFVTFRMSCATACGLPCPPGNRGAAQQRVQLVMPEEIPPWASVWAYVPHPSLPRAEWRRVAAHIEGRRIDLVLRGGPFQPDIAGADPWFRGHIAISVPWQPPPASPPVAGMWWAGEDQKGWGLSIAERRGQLAGMLYAYDASGRPTAYALDGGPWNGFDADYVATVRRAPSSLGAGQAVGEARVHFHGTERAQLAVEIEGVRASWPLSKLAAAAPSERARSRAGLYESVLDGGTVTLDAVGDPLFLVWARPTSRGGEWLFGEARWAADGRLAGELLRPSSSPWLVSPYAAARLSVSSVGSFDITFGDDGRARFRATVVTDRFATNMPIARREF